MAIVKSKLLKQLSDNYPNFLKKDLEKFTNIIFNEIKKTLKRGERIDCAISEMDFKKRKVSLSIKLLEELQKKEALEKYGSEGSGKNLPFSSLSEDLKKKEEEK